MKKIALLLSIISIFLVSCSNNNKTTSDNDNIKLGITIPTTGQYSNYGNSTLNGMNLAIEEINNNGGIGGKKIEVELLDDKGEVTDAVTSYNKLVGDGVDAVIGSITSAPSLAVAEASKNDFIPVITPTGTEVNITSDKPNVFRTCFTNPYQGELLAIFSKNNLNAKTASILVNTSSDYSVGIADNFEKKAKELGIEILSRESYGNNDTDFKAQLTTISKDNPDVLLIPEYYEKLSLITPQARISGINSTFIGGDGWDGILKTMDKNSYDIVENSYFTNHFSLDDESEEVKDFIEKYRENYNEDPTAFSALGYDTIYILKNGFENAKSDKNEDRVEAINSIDFKGITGSFKFDENNNPKKAASIIKIVDGEYKFDSVVNPE